MLNLAYEEKNTWNSTQGYAATNEEPLIFNSLLGKKKFSLGGGIASGGEIPLFVLLPRCDKVIAIDHSYKALSAIWLKLLLLDKIGPAEMKRTLLEDNYESFIKKLNDVLQHVPESIRKYVTLKHSQGHPYTSPTFSSSDFSDTRREWLKITAKEMQLALNRIDRLTLVHGDLSDLKPYGKFDIFYTSNATGHSNRDGKNPRASDFASYLKPKGLYLTVAQIYNDNRWKQLKTVNGTNSSWQYYIYQRKAKVKLSPKPKGASE
jgi:hypothetical protein